MHYRIGSIGMILLAVVLATGAAFQASDPCNGQGPCINGICQGSGVPVGTPHPTGHPQPGWGPMPGTGRTVYGIWTPMAQSFRYTTCPTPRLVIVDKVVGFNFDPCWWFFGSTPVTVAPEDPLPPEWPDPGPTGPSGGPNPPGPNSTWNCFGEAVGTGPLGPINPPFGGGGCWFGPWDIANLLHNSSCYISIGTCDPATAAKGTIFVLYKQQYIYRADGTCVPLGPAKPEHAGTANGDGSVADKPGATPYRPSVPFGHEPGPDSFVGPYIGGLNPCGSGRWCGTTINPNGETIVTEVFLVCYIKTC